MPTTLNTHPPRSEGCFSRNLPSKPVFQDQGRHPSQLPLDQLQSELRLCRPVLAKPDEPLSPGPSVHWHHRCPLCHGDSSHLSDNVSDSLESLSLSDPSTEPSSQQRPCENCHSCHHSQTRWQTAATAGNSLTVPLRRDTTTHSNLPAAHPAGFIPGYFVPHTSCRQAALWEDDVTVDDLAGYMDQLLHLPKPMSDMAELMYAWFVHVCKYVLVTSGTISKICSQVKVSFLLHLNINSFPAVTIVCSRCGCYRKYDWVWNQQW